MNGIIIDGNIYEPFEDEESECPNCEAFKFCHSSGCVVDRLCDYFDCDGFRCNQVLTDKLNEK